MSERTPPSFLQSGSHPADNTRLLLEALLSKRGGVVSTGDLAVSEKSGTPDMSVDIAGGHGVVEGSLNAAQGLYHVYNDATVNLGISAADPTDPRKDLVVATVRDSFYSGADDDWLLQVVTGTPTPGLTQGNATGEPATPANSLKLARVFVAAGETAITDAELTDLRTGAAASGGLIRCTSATRPSFPWEGMAIYETDTDRLHTWDGSAWQAPGPAGQLALAEATADQIGITTTTVDLTGLAIQFTLAATRGVKIIGDVLYQKNAPDTSSATVILITDENNVGVQQRNNNVNAPGQTTMHIERTLTLGAGTHDFKLRGSTQAGFVNVDNSASAPGFIQAIDLGPA